MRRIRYVACLLGLLPAVALGKLNIVTTATDYADIARQIGGTGWRSTR